MSGNLFKGCQFPKAVILDAVYHKLRFSLSYREIEEILANKGIRVDHATIARWVVKFSPCFEKVFRRKKMIHIRSWYLDETYIKVKGKWYYYYRIIDRNNQTVDYYFSKKRNKKAVKRLLTRAFNTNGVPEMITIDKSGSNYHAIKDFNKNYCGKPIIIRDVKYKNNRVEQDHRFIKKRTNPMLGFKSFRTALATLKGLEVVRMIQKKQFLPNIPMTNFQKFLHLTTA